MYEEVLVSREDYLDTVVYRPRKVTAMNRSDIRKIETALELKCEKEATKLYRLAGKMIRHGCSAESIDKCRDEARALHRIGGMNLWEVLNPFVRWEYAFKF